VCGDSGVEPPRADCDGEAKEDEVGFLGLERLNMAARDLSSKPPLGAVEIALPVPLDDINILFSSGCVSKRHTLHQ